MNRQLRRDRLLLFPRERTIPEKMSFVGVEQTTVRIENGGRAGPAGGRVDHPYLTVAAVCNVYGSLTPFLQFVGRVMRRISDQDREEGVVVFHAEPARRPDR